MHLPCFKPMASVVRIKPHHLLLCSEGPVRSNPVHDLSAPHPDTLSPVHTWLHSCPFHLFNRPWDLAFVIHTLKLFVYLFTVQSSPERKFYGGKGSSFAPYSSYLPHLPCVAHSECSNHICWGRISPLHTGMGCSQHLYHMTAWKDGREAWRTTSGWRPSPISSATGPADG